MNFLLSFLHSKHNHETSFRWKNQVLYSSSLMLLPSSGVDSGSNNDGVRVYTKVLPEQHGFGALSVGLNKRTTGEES